MIESPPNTYQLEQVRQALGLQVPREVAVEDGAGGREDEVDAGLLRLPGQVHVEQGAEAGLRSGEELLSLVSWELR